MKIICSILVTLVRVAVAATGQATLHIETVSLVGESIDAQVEIRLVNADNSPALTVHSPGSIMLSPGLYAISVFAPGFARRTQLVELSGEQMFVRVGLNTARLTDEQPKSISGRILLAKPSRAKLWVKLVALTNNYATTDTRVASDGSFIFRNLPAGEFVIHVIEGSSRLRATRQIYCCSDSGVAVTIDL